MTAQNLEVVKKAMEKGKIIGKRGEKDKFFRLKSVLL